MSQMQATIVAMERQSAHMEEHVENQGMVLAEATSALMAAATVQPMPRPAVVAIVRLTAVEWPALGTCR